MVEDAAPNHVIHAEFSTEGETTRFIKSPIVKRSLTIGKHKTSVSLEAAFWDEFRAIAQSRKIAVSALAGVIDVERKHSNLSSAIRLFVLDTLTRGARPVESHPPAPDGSRHRGVGWLSGSARSGTVPSKKWSG